MTSILLCGAKGKMGKAVDSIVSADNDAKIVAAAKEEANRIIAHAQTEAEVEKKKLADDVKKEMISVAAAMAKKAVGESMDYDIQERLVEETLKEIGDSTWLS